MRQNDEWENFYDDFNTDFERNINNNTEIKPSAINFDFDDTQQDVLDTIDDNLIFQVDKYIVGAVPQGLIIIDTSRAMERINFEKILSQLKNHNGIAQTDMFPETIDLSYEDGLIMEESADKIFSLGFRYEKMGQTRYVITAHPDYLELDATKPFFEEILTDMKEEYDMKSNDKDYVLAKRLAKRTMKKTNEKLLPEEMQTIIKKLSQCDVKDTDLDGRKIYVIMENDSLSQLFK